MNIKKLTFDEQLMSFGRMIKAKEGVNRIRIDVKFKDGRNIEYDSYYDKTIEFKCSECGMAYSDEKQSKECCE